MLLTYGHFYLNSVHFYAKHSQTIPNFLRRFQKFNLNISLFTGHAVIAVLICLLLTHGHFYLNSVHFDAKHSHTLPIFTHITKIALENPNFYGTHGYIHLNMFARCFLQNGYVYLNTCTFLYKTLNFTNDNKNSYYQGLRLHMHKYVCFLFLLENLFSTNSKQNLSTMMMHKFAR